MLGIGKNRSTTPKQRRKMPYDLYVQDIGIVGLGNAGKTVFLTSLIDNIKLNGFNDRNKPNFRNFKTINKHMKHYSRFPYENYRARISKCKWPEKTGKPFCYSCCFGRSDWNVPLRFNFYDLPGERLADVAMFKTSYEEWCSKALHDIGGCQHKFDISEALKQEIEDYVQFCREKSNTSTAIIERYKSLLKQLEEHYSTFITPSTWMLDFDRDGGSNENREPLVGVDEDHQFAPLPADVFKDRKELVKEFAKSYRYYKRVVVNPVFKQMKKCTQLLILADIPEILCANVQTFNDTCHIIDDLLDSCKPRNNLPKRIINSVSAHRFKVKGVRQVALVATKSDLIRQDQKEMNKLRHLLNEMAGQNLDDLKVYKVATGIFSCAAVCCTEKNVNDASWNSGYTICDIHNNTLPHPEKDEEMRSYPVSELPKEWPDAWEECDYDFPEVYPIYPSNARKPPKEAGLYHIFSFICGDNHEQT